MSEGRKDDAGKADWFLMPWGALTEVQKVLDHGAKKYGAFNWVHVPRPHWRYLSALFRHVVAYICGQTNDPETGLHHLAHATCCCLFLIHFDQIGVKYESPTRIR